MGSNYFTSAQCEVVLREKRMEERNTPRSNIWGQCYAKINRYSETLPSQTHLGPQTYLLHEKMISLTWEISDNIHTYFQNKDHETSQKAACPLSNTNLYM